MPELGWKEATVEVLQNSTEPMHYTDIAEAIVERGFRKDVGATPAATVATAISISLKNEGDDSPFVRVSRGYYALKETPNAVPEPAVEAEEEPQQTTGLINAFGMFWARTECYGLPGRNSWANSKWAVRQSISMTKREFTCFTMVVRSSMWGALPINPVV